MADSLYQYLRAIPDKRVATALNKILERILPSTVEKGNEGTVLAATIAEINQAADVSAMFEVVTAVNTIGADENGKTFFIDNATGFAQTLPAPALGLRFTFINKTANTSGNHTVVTASSANIIIGNQNSVAGDAGDSGTADDTISFVANQSVPGDRVHVVSDGTKWYAYAISKVAAGVTFTQAS